MHEHFWENVDMDIRAMCEGFSVLLTFGSTSEENKEIEQYYEKKISKIIKAQENSSRVDSNN